MSRGAEKTRVPLLMRDRSFYHTFLILAGTLILEQAVVLSVNLWRRSTRSSSWCSR